MIQHVFRLIRTQWKKNLWIILELFVVCTLLWYVVDYFSVMFINSRTPVGFTIEDTYVVKLSHYKAGNRNHIVYEEGSDEPALNFLRIADHIDRHPDVQGLSIGQWHYPYCTSNQHQYYLRDSLHVYAQVLYVTPAYFRMFDVRPADGGSPAELATALINGVILSSDMERQLFPDSHALGQAILSRDSMETYRVSAVTTSLKPYLFTRPSDYIYVPFDGQMLTGRDEEYINDHVSVAIKTRQGMNEKDFAATFRKEMSAQLSIGNYYLAGITPISELRDFMLRSNGVIESAQYRTGFTLFFLLNVFLGVIGTFWLRIKKRKAEIGLRIAVGSSRRKVMGLMLVESLALMLIALIPAVLIWINLALTDILPVNEADMNGQRFLLNSLFTIVPLGLVVAAATWYPAYRSATVQPAEALHYE